MATTREDTPVLVERSRAAAPGLCVAVLCALLLVIALMRPIEAWVPCLFVAGVLLGLVLMVRGLNRRFALFPDRPEARDALRRTVSVPLSQVVRARLRHTGPGAGQLEVSTAAGLSHHWEVGRRRPEHLAAIAAVFGANFSEPVQSTEQSQEITWTSPLPRPDSDA